MRLIPRSKLGVQVGESKPAICTVGFVTWGQVWIVCGGKSDTVDQAKGRQEPSWETRFLWWLTAKRRRGEMSGIQVLTRSAGSKLCILHGPGTPLEHERRLTGSWRNLHKGVGGGVWTGNGGTDRGGGGTWRCG